MASLHPTPKCGPQTMAPREPSCRHTLYSSQVSPSRQFFWANRSGMFIDRFCVNLLCFSAMLHFMFFAGRHHMVVPTARKKTYPPTSTPERMRPALGHLADMALKPPKLLPARPQQKLSTHRLTSVAGETAQKKTTSGASLAPCARIR